MEDITVLLDGVGHRASVRDGVIVDIMRDQRANPSGAIWTTGFVDMHCHGGAGCSFDDADAQGINAAVTYHRDHGTTGIVLSLVSASIPQLVHRLHQLRDIIPATPGALGVHLEGPFLAPGRRGAHDPAALTPPTPDAVDALLEAGEGLLRQVAIAPELPHAITAIDTFVAAGVRVAVGHTEADYTTAAFAFDRGASLLTHAFNAMPGLGHREPGPVGAALDREHVTLEVIADGHHVHPTLIRTLFAAAPNRIALVTDAMSATGLGNGEYQLGGLAVEVRDGKPLLAGTQTLAGSTLTMARAVEVAVAAGVTPSEAASAATSTPARALGIGIAPVEPGVALSELNYVPATTPVG